MADLDPIQQLKVPPHSLEAEQSVLGGLLLDNQAWERVADVLQAADFYRGEHRLIFEHISKLVDANQPADIITVMESLQRTNALEQAGGSVYLTTLVANVPGSTNIRAYAALVRERSVMRSLVSVASRIADSAFNPAGRNAAELLDEAEKLVFDIAEMQSRGQKGFVAIDDLLQEVIDRINVLYERENQDDVTGVATGFADLDERTSGLQPGDLIIVAGRPSMGKTSLALNMAEHVALKVRKPVAVFSMEMGGAQLVMRMIGSVGRIDQHRMRNGKLGNDEWDRLSLAMEKMQQARLWIDETGALNPIDLRARARRLARQCNAEGGLGLIVIDYLQLMSVQGEGENRATEISEISRSLKALAKELQVPVVALSQLNRGLEQRPNKRPVMSDLRESGAIEQDADVILFIYRDEVYNPESTDKGIAEIIIGKQRNGPIGTVRLMFQGEYTRFENLAHGAPRYDAD
ncbi:MAG: replicative DNA helicase [Rhodocyclaceae bacterium]|nr:replicative DNA helicase [Rhodocyclaceae bacterium]